MENKIEKTVKALKEIETYCSAHCLAELNFAVAVLEKLERDGIDDPLHTDFSALGKQG